MLSKKFVIIFIIIGLILINIVILSIGTQSQGRFGFFQKMAMEVLSPCQRGITSIFQYVEGIWYRYFDLILVKEENKQLRATIGLLKNRINHLKEAEIANRRLRTLLDFKPVVLDATIPAEVIGKEPSRWFKTIIINKGNADNVRRGMPVVAPGGIVGQVIQVAYHYSKVLLIIDQNSAVDALVQRTRSRGIVEGGGKGLCRFEYVLRMTDVQGGDVVISSGLGGVFPKGLRIGHVVNIVKSHAGIFQEVILQPYVDFAKLEEVLVVVRKQTFFEDEGEDG
jgi:rod shape-determining protein MreC